MKDIESMKQQLAFNTVYASDEASKGQVLKQSFDNIAYKVLNVWSSANVRW